MQLFLHNPGLEPRDPSGTSQSALVLAIGEIDGPIERVDPIKSIQILVEIPLWSLYYLSSLKSYCLLL